MPTAHAKLSPSSSARWLHCAGSIPLNSDDSSVYQFHADQGTAAHSLLEMCHRIGVDPQRFLGTAIFKDHVVDDEMAEAVGHALDYVHAYLAKHKHAKLHIEKEVDPYKMLRCEPGYTSGTPDMTLDNSYDLELVVIDYKHGAGVPVEVEGNTQILQYLGAFWAQYCTRPYKRYKAVIVQPRSRHEEGPVREHVYTHEQVMAHMQRIKRRIIEIKKHPDQREAGDWCKWCRGAARCPALWKKAQELAQLEFKDKPVKGKDEAPKDPKGISIRDLENIMQFADVLEHWLKEVRAAMQTHLLKGGKSRLWKLVRGRMGNRYWKDDAKVQAVCKALGLKPDDYMPRSLLGVPGIEKVFKKRGKKDLPTKLTALIGRSEAGLHVARKDDPRPEVERGQEFIGK